jgi:hypothetical protein
MNKVIVVMTLAALVAAGCNEAPTASPTGDALTKGQTSTAAKPALAYEGSLMYKGSRTRTVSVMDADGTHQTNLFGTTEARGEHFRDASWSPTGTSICFSQSNLSNTAPVASIKALDVSVNSSGIAVASNVRTIYNVPPGSGLNPGTAWSSTAAMGKIAFCPWNPNSTDRTLWVVPQTGGAPIKVWGSDATYIKEDGSVLGHRQSLGYPTWSPDDERLAVVRYDSSGTPDQYVVSTIMIFTTGDNGNSWSYTDSIKVSAAPGATVVNMYYLEWSRAGMNKLAYGNAQDGLLYYVDPQTRDINGVLTVPTTNGVTGTCPSWSPDNGTLIFNNTAGANSDYLSRIVPFTTTVTNVVQSPADVGYPLVRWKR